MRGFKSVDSNFQQKKAQTIAYKLDDVKLLLMSKKSICKMIKYHNCNGQSYYASVSFPPSAIQHSSKLTLL